MRSRFGAMSWSAIPLLFATRPKWLATSEFLWKLRRRLPRRFEAVPVVPPTLAKHLPQHRRGSDEPILDDDIGLFCQQPRPERLGAAVLSHSDRHPGLVQQFALLAMVEMDALNLVIGDVSYDSLHPEGQQHYPRLTNYQLALAQEPPGTGEQTGRSHQHTEDSLDGLPDVVPGNGAVESHGGYRKADTCPK